MSIALIDYFIFDHVGSLIINVIFTSQIVISFVLISITFNSLLIAIYLYQLIQNLNEIFIDLLIILMLDYYSYHLFIFIILISIFKLFLSAYFYHPIHFSNYLIDLLNFSSIHPSIQVFLIIFGIYLQ
jgi:hypothetical protein